MLARNKTASVDEFTNTKFIVISKLNRKIPFALSVNESSVIPVNTAQTILGGTSNAIAMRIFVANYLIFRSSELSVNTRDVFIDEIVFI